MSLSLSHPPGSEILCKRSQSALAPTVFLLSNVSLQAGLRTPVKWCGQLPLATLYLPLSRGGLTGIWRLNDG